MSYAIPDPRWEEPNLLIPGVKPTGPVVIDWGHPLARGLVSCVLPDASHQSDLVSGATITQSTNSAYTHNTVERTAGSGGDITYKAITSVQSDAYSSFSIYRPDTLILRACIWAWGDRALAAGYGDPSQVFAYTRAAGANYLWETTAGFFVAGEIIHVGFSYDDGDNTKGGFYKNGSLDGEHKRSGSYTLSPSDEIIVLSTGQEVVDADGGLYLNCIWHDRILTAKEHESLSRDPYQFLLPA